MKLGQHAFRMMVCEKIARSRQDAKEQSTADRNGTKNRHLGMHDYRIARSKKNRKDAVVQHRPQHKRSVLVCWTRATIKKHSMFFVKHCVLCS